MQLVAVESVCRGDAPTISGRLVPEVLLLCKPILPASYAVSTT